MSSNFWLADEQFDKTSSHFRTSRVACRVWMTGACCLASYSASSEAIAGPLPGSAIAQRMSREGDVPANSVPSRCSTIAANAGRRQVSSNGCSRFWRAI